MKTQKGSRGIAPLILNLSTTQEGAVNFFPKLLYPQGKNTKLSIELEVGWAPELLLHH